MIISHNRNSESEGCVKIADPRIKIANDNLGDDRGSMFRKSQYVITCKVFDKMEFHLQVSQVILYVYGAPFNSNNDFLISMFF